jgi:hypothetical protein
MNMAIIMPQIAKSLEYSGVLQVVHCITKLVYISSMLMYNFLT